MYPVITGKILLEYWDTTEEAAKASNCGVCVAFDISERMKDCLPVIHLTKMENLVIVGCTSLSALVQEAAHLGKRWSQLRKRKKVQNGRAKHLAHRV